MTNYKNRCAELVQHLDDTLNFTISSETRKYLKALISTVRSELAEPEPQRRCLYSPVQIAECGGPCEQGPEHCDCGELCVTEPEPEGPTDEELMALAVAVFEYEFATDKDYARAVLARWGRPAPAPQPIPVTERLPKAKDCDAGRCWWGAPALPGLAPASWRFVSTEDRFGSELYWLPAITLPLPQ